MSDVPAEHFLHVAEAMNRLIATGVPVRSLFVSVVDGELELRDAIGSYGVRRFDAAPAVQGGEPR